MRRPGPRKTPPQTQQQHKYSYGQIPPPETMKQAYFGNSVAYCCKVLLINCVYKIFFVYIKLSC
jgi:hypothetical protein